MSIKKVKSPCRERGSLGEMLQKYFIWKSTFWNADISTDLISDPNLIYVAGSWETMLSCENALFVQCCVYCGGVKITNSMQVRLVV